MPDYLPVCNPCAGAVYKYDLSMPVGEMYSLVEDMRQRLAGLPVQARRLSSLPASRAAELKPPTGVHQTLHTSYWWKMHGGM